MDQGPFLWDKTLLFSKTNQHILMSIQTLTSTCYHCGNPCDEELLWLEEKSFCCQGCKSVFTILSQNNLCDYYSIEQAPGVRSKFPYSENKFNYLDDEAIQSKLILYRDETLSKVQFHIPTMHCSSCIWLLENLFKIHEGIKRSRVDFIKKKIDISFQTNVISLRGVVELLASLGYEPAIHLEDIEGKIKKETDRTLLYRIGVAGFCFGNIMLISFPEYFGLDLASKIYMSKLFGYLNFSLALPVFFYSAQDYFKGAWSNLKHKVISIDLPLAVGILVMFLRSAYEVISQSGPGWFDTLAGLVFFLLVGKWFQQRTFETLSFERDYKSYFPVAVNVRQSDGLEPSVPVNQLKIGDRIIIRNNELIPADSILLSGNAQIDFSFVTGEQLPIQKTIGEIVYAGGRQKGETIELEVMRLVSQSYLTSLWNNELYAKNRASSIETFQQKISKYFTIGLFLLAIMSAIYWFIFNPNLAMPAFTSVLIIACPCALALSSPFATGNAMRLLGKNKFYIKSNDVIEQMAHINRIVLDKTGTITQSSESKIEYHGRELSDHEQKIIYSMVKHSLHPLSRKLAEKYYQIKAFEFQSYEEVQGKGINAEIAGSRIRIGSDNFAGKHMPKESSGFHFLTTRVHLEIDGTWIGVWMFQHGYRKGLKDVLKRFQKMHYKLSMVSGDNASEKSVLKTIFPLQSELLFEQLPEQKMQYIEQLQSKQEKVMMIGDGLNDAIALKAAQIGISVTEDTAHFSPASDAIMEASVFEKLPDYLSYCKSTIRVIHLSFAISLCYNFIGLSFAVSGNLSPVIAAILMPLSSVSVIAFTTLSTYLYARKFKIVGI